jgi:hypothetical protein
MEGGRENMEGERRKEEEKKLEAEKDRRRGSIKMKIE